MSKTRITLNPDSPLEDLTVERDSDSLIHIVGTQDGDRLEIVLDRDEAARLAIELATKAGPR